jgi:hypothetical protein
MARVNVTTQKVTRAGLVPATTAVTVDGDVIDAGAVALWVNNASASPVTVTVQTPLTVDGLNLEELAVAVAAGTTKLIGPFPGRTFARPAGATDSGRIYVDYSAQTNINRAVIAL